MSGFICLFIIMLGEMWENWTIYVILKKWFIPGKLNIQCEYEWDVIMKTFLLFVLLLNCSLDFKNCSYQEVEEVMFATNLKVSILLIISLSNISKYNLNFTQTENLVSLNTDFDMGTCLLTVLYFFPLYIQGE